MPGRKHLEPEKVIDLVMNKGIATNYVAERFGCKTAAVTELLKRNGYTFHQANKTWVRVSPHDTCITR